MQRVATFDIVLIIEVETWREELKKFLFFLLMTFIVSNCVFANDFDFEPIQDSEQIYYDYNTNSWERTFFNLGELCLTKKLYDGAGSYSQYTDASDNIVLTLRTDYEFIKDNELYAINNEELKYYKIVYNGENFVEVPLDFGEVQILFPDVEIIRLSLIDDDNKMWIHKPFLKDKKILFINDSDKYYHKLSPKDKKAQTSDIKGLITLYRYGIYNFVHFGKRDGKLIIYVR